MFGENYAQMQEITSADEGEHAWNKEVSSIISIQLFGSFCTLRTVLTPLINFLGRFAAAMRLMPPLRAGSLWPASIPCGPPVA